MEKVKKRIFVGNLPSGITESKVNKKFSKFGNVTNIEIKTSSDITVPSCYAFLDLETDATYLDSCFENLPKENWNGRSIKLEFAKESFLSRLQKERHEVKAKSHQEPTPKDEHTAKSYDLITSTGRQTSTLNKRQRFDNDDDSSEINQGSIDFDHQKSLNVTSMPSEKSGSKYLLEKFESFSDVWKDPPTLSSHKRNRNYDNAKYDDFEIVPQNREQSKIDCPSSRSKSEGKLVNNKTDESEAKRLKSVQERKQTFLQQKEAVKLALAAVDSKVKTNNKIIFDDELDEEETAFSNNLQQLDKPQKASLKGRHGPQLFEDEGGEEEQDYDFTIRKQFEGKKGQKLLDLQSRYANDKRFTLDDRFYESDDSADDEGGPPEEGSIEEERRKQLEILQSIVGRSLPHTHDDKKVKPTNVDNMVVHYDPTIDDHAKYEIKQEKPKKVKASLSTRLERRLDEKMARKKQKRDFQADLPPVSREKFYKVSENLKESLKSDGKSFSLLETFGSIEEKKEPSNNEDTYSTLATNKTKSHNLSSNPFKWDSSDSEDEIEDKPAVPVPPVPQNQSSIEAPLRVRGIWRESFFLRANDERLSDGLKFFSQGENVNENFSQRRRQVQRIVSAKVRKSTHKSTTFRLGGKRGRKTKKFMGKRK